MRHWYDEKNAGEAPLWMGAEEAKAWAEGWNAAVKACTEEQNEIVRREIQGGRHR